MFKVTLFVLALGTCSLAFDSSLDDIWKNFKNHYHKRYINEDELARRYVFEKKVAIISRHNLEADMGLHSYRRGLNRFSDLTVYEYRSIALGRMRFNVTKYMTDRRDDETKLPTSVDWRRNGYVTPIIDHIAGGWAIAPIGALEGQHKAVSGKLVALSTQNLMDCVPESEGCSGGTFNSSYTYMIKNGIDTEACYPFEKVQGPCSFKKSCIGATMKGVNDIESGSEAKLQDATANIGPICVGIDASHESLQDYVSGVYDEPSCSTTDLDHMVLIVGYGVQDGTDYWIVKNSWGTEWGMKGYILMSRNKNNQCGIATAATYPTGVGI